MQFSIIVPIYNVESYLNRCIESVISQTFLDFELILVDDGSPDRCPEICDGYSQRDDRIKVIHKQNGGVSSARNAGLKIAVGDYVLFVDSDDYWCDTSLLLKLSNRIADYKEEIILMGCKISYMNGYEEITRGNYNLDLISRHNKEETLNYLFNSNNMPGSAWIMCVSKRVIQSNRLMFKTGVTAEDYEWMVSLLLAASSIGAIEGIHYVYIKRSGSLSQKTTILATYGMLNAVLKYKESEHHYKGLDNYVTQIFLFLLLSYKNLTPNDKLIVRSVIYDNLDIFKMTGHNIYFYFIVIMGLNVSSMAIAMAYSIKRPIQMAKKQK